MKAGIVTTIRVNPKDAQSVLDVMEKAGVRTANMSFAQMTALAFQSLLEAARQSGTLPEPDSFQYLNRLQPYIKAKHGMKLEVTKAIGSIGAKLEVPPIPASRPEPEGEAASPQVHPTPAPAVVEPAPVYDAEEIRWAGKRLTELLAKKDAVDDGVAGIIWSHSDEEEYLKCFAIVYPDG